jgi:amino acid permease
MDIRQHHGIFRKQISLYEGVALVTAGTIGAGVLGIPYAIAEVGIVPGMILLFAIGLLMMGVNLLVADIAMNTPGNHQLPGFAEAYLGRTGKWAMTAVIYLSFLGALVVYIIGEGETLSALFGGDPFFWSVGFFFGGSALIALGLRTIKKVELFLSMALLAVVLLITLRSAPHVDARLWQTADWTKLFVPYGVLVFAYSGAASVPEAWSIMKNRKRFFKKAIVIAGTIVIAVYTVFTLIVVGVTGQGTTEIATIGLGRTVGPTVYLLGNLFAAIAMGTVFLIVGTAMRDSLAWDFKAPRWAATLLVLGAPFLMFLFGLRGFINTIDIVGGVFLTIEILLILCIWLKSRKRPSTPAP